MSCWDCYRLVKIVEALGYQEILGNIYSIRQGIEAWSSFVVSQKPLAAS